MALDREGRRQRLDPGLRGDRLQAEGGGAQLHGARLHPGAREQDHQRRAPLPEEPLGVARLHQVAPCALYGIPRRFRAQRFVAAMAGDNHTKSFNID